LDVHTLGRKITRQAQNAGPDGAQSHGPTGRGGVRMLPKTKTTKGRSEDSIFTASQ